ncbi:hypothetical protein BH11PSE8_BH11PSE8_38750 [soil metagenome]
MVRSRAMDRESPMNSTVARWVAASVLAVASVVTVSNVHAQPAPGAMAPGAGPGPGGMHHRPPMGHPGMEPGMMMFGGSPEHIGRAVDHMLDGLSATDAQRTQVKEIAVAAAADLKAQREAERGLHERSMQIFTAPTVDAAAAESVRQQMQSQRDQSSRRVMQAMLDVSRVLTPKQRAQLGVRMKQQHAMMQDRMERMERSRGMHESGRPGSPHGAPDSEQPKS